MILYFASKSLEHDGVLFKANKKSKLELDVITFLCVFAPLCELRLDSFFYEPCAPEEP
jgi:hypothetical protein